MDTIKSLEINISLPNDTSQASAMDDAHRCYEQYFQKAIENALSSFDDSLKSIIPKIEIDLGIINEQDIPSKLEKTLKEEVARLLRESTHESVQSAQNSDLLLDMDRLQTTDEGRVRSWKEELFLEYVKYISEGYSKFEVLGNRYTNEEISELIEEELIISEYPDNREWMIKLIHSALIDSFPLSFLRMKETLPFPVFSDIILKSVAPYFKEGSRVIKNMISYNIDSETVSLALLIATESIVQGSKDNHSFLGIERGLSLVKELASHGMHVVNDNIKTNTIGDTHTNSESKEIDINALSRGFNTYDDYVKFVETIIHGSKTEQAIAELKHIANIEISHIAHPLEKRTNRLFIDDAGLVILHPFFRPLFSRIGLIDDQDNFISLEHQIRAVHILKYLVEGNSEKHCNNSLVFCKLLCGLPYEILIDDEYRLIDNEKDEVESLMSSILQYWNPFKSSSFESTRQAFIKREGTVEMDETGHIVRVSGSSLDILMDDIPWEISIIYLPWTSPFTIEWQQER